MAELPRGGVTFCFTDIEGSTQLFAKLGPRFLDLLEKHRAIVRNTFEAHKGAEVRSEGDGFFFAFGDAGDAVRGAVDLQRELASYPWPADARISVRIGLHTGDAEPSGGDYLVFAVHEAARISAAAHGGQIVMSPATAASLKNASGGFTMLDLGEHTLKDLEPMRIFQVCHPDLRTEFPPLRYVGVMRGYVPAPASALIGRSDDLDELRSKISSSRLVTVTGAGGIGKTRIAIEAGREQLGQRSDGVWFVDLAPVNEPGWIDDTVIDALGVQRNTDVEPRAQLLDYLSARNALLVIDNCEHLVDDCSAFIDDVVRSCPGITIVATSREALGIDGEVAWRCPSLESDHGATLFADRALLVNPNFTLDEETTKAIDLIVERLDGIPLAIELAAAKVRVLSAQQIAERLDDRFRLLTGGSRTAMARQRTLEATVEWSYGLLDDDERLLLDRLSVFVGSFDLEAVEVVCGIEALEPLERLVAKSMVVASLGDGIVRYRLLETIRHFARDKLIAAGAGGDLRDRHLEHYSRLVVEIGDGMMDSREISTTAWITTNYPNIRAALEWATSTTPQTAGLALAAHMSMFWSTTGRPAEGLVWLESVLSETTGADPDLVARAHAGAAHQAWLEGVAPDRVRAHIDAALAWMTQRGGAPKWYEAGANLLLLATQSDTGALTDHDGYRRASEMAEQSGNDFVLSRALLEEGVHALDQDNTELAKEKSAAALAAARRGGSISSEGSALRQIASMKEDEHDLVGGLELARQAVAAARRTPNVYALAFSLQSEGHSYERLGDLKHADRSYLDALELARERGMEREIAQTLIDVGWLRMAQGEIDAAEACFIEARDVAAKRADTRFEELMIAGLAGHSLAEIAHARGQHEFARMALDANLKMARNGDGWLQAYVHNSIGWLDTSVGDLEGAENQHRTGLELTKDRSFRFERLAFAGNVRGLAGVSLVRGDATESARLSGAASSVKDPNTNTPRYSTLLHKQVMADARAALGDEKFDAAFAEGAAAGLDYVSALAP